MPSPELSDLPIKTGQAEQSAEAQPIKAEKKSQQSYDAFWDDFGPALRPAVIYMIGGTSRDYLLNIKVDDFDFVSDATPGQMREFLSDANYRFEKFGTVKLKLFGQKVDITTLRIENNYKDFRHPNEIIFTNDLSKDYVRRDFTINAIYIDEKYMVHDFCNGIDDLKNHIIRFIGDPYIRIKEDPLRILRAERFAKKLNFIIEEKSFKAIKDNYSLINELNPQKVNEEKRKEFK